MATLEWLHEKVVRLGDAIFSLEEIGAHPEFVSALKSDLEAAHNDENAELQSIKEYPRLSAEGRKENIPAEIRWAVFERDDFRCKQCGTRRNLTVDHIFPESKGGELTMDNLQTLCKSCNSKKGVRCG